MVVIIIRIKKCKMIIAFGRVESSRVGIRSFVSSGGSIHKPIISVLVCFLDFVHDFIGDVFYSLCGVPGIEVDIEGLLGSSYVFVFFDDFLDFRCHLCGRHIFVVEVVITR